MAASGPTSESESQFSTILYDISNEVQRAVENMLTMTNEINQNCAVIEEEIEKYKDSAIERKRALDEEKEQFLKAAYAVLNMLNNRD